MSRKERKEKEGKRKERRKRNLPQSQKKNFIKPSLWDRIGYVPNKKSTREIHLEDYRRRLAMNLPEGKGTNRSLGSNRALQKKCGYFR